MKVQKNFGYKKYGSKKFVQKRNLVQKTFDPQNIWVKRSLGQRKTILSRKNKTWLTRSSCYNIKTRPSSDSEAATMYKLKGKSSNMRTGQGFK